MDFFQAVRTSSIYRTKHKSGRPFYQRTQYKQQSKQAFLPRSQYKRYLVGVSLTNTEQAASTYSQQAEGLHVANALLLFVVG